MEQASSDQELLSLKRMLLEQQISDPDQKKAKDQKKAQEPEEAQDLEPSAITQHEAYQERVRNSIKRQYVILKDAGKGADGFVLYCLPRAHARTISSGPVTPAEIAPIAEILRKKVVMVKFPQRPSIAEAFLKEISVLNHLRNKQGCVKIIANETLTGPWFAMTWIRGPTLWRMIASGMHISPKLIWHVVASLLAIVLSIRGDLDKNPETIPIVHADIHMEQIIFDPSTFTHSPFPDVRLIDFGRAETGAPRANLVPNVKFYKRLPEDLQAIGEIFHQLAHKGYLVKADRAFRFHRLDENGRCRCRRATGIIELELAPSVTDFQVGDREFEEMIAKLTGPGVLALRGTSLEDLITTARRRSKTDVIPWQLDRSWDIGRELLPDQVLLDATE